MHIDAIGYRIIPATYSRSLNFLNSRINKMIRFMVTTKYPQRVSNNLVVFSIFLEWQDFGITYFILE